MKNAVFWDKKNSVHTSQETHYFSATEPNQLILCKIWGFHSCDYEKCRLLAYKTQKFLRSMRQLLVTATFLFHWFLSPWWWRHYLPLKCRFLQEPHGVTSPKTPFHIVTAIDCYPISYCIIMLTLAPKCVIPDILTFRMKNKRKVDIFENIFMTTFSIYVL
jgi:hypothetical protein